MIGNWIDNYAQYGVIYKKNHNLTVPHHDMNMLGLLQIHIIRGEPRFRLLVGLYCFSSY